MSGRRRTYSAVFIDAARMFDTLTRELIEDYDDREVTVNAGRTVGRLNKVYSINTIVNAAMYIEANINEFYRQALSDEDHVIYADEPDSLFPKSFYSNLRAGEGGFRDYYLRDKYRKFLDNMGEERFEEDEDPWDSFDLLIRLRNHFVHYKSEWYDAMPDPEPHEIVDRLAGKGVPPSPWLSVDNMVYPHRAFGPGLTSWAVRTAENLTDDFHERVGADRRYDLTRRW